MVYNGMPTQEVLNAISNIDRKHMSILIEFLTERSKLHSKFCCSLRDEVEVRKSQGAYLELEFLNDLFENPEVYKEQIRTAEAHKKLSKEVSIGAY